MSCTLVTPNSLSLSTPKSRTFVISSCERKTVVGVHSYPSFLLLFSVSLIESYPFPNQISIPSFLPCPTYPVWLKSKDPQPMNLEFSSESKVRETLSITKTECPTASREREGLWTHTVLFLLHKNGKQSNTSSLFQDISILSESSKS